jgi:hypothetical protein
MLDKDNVSLVLSVDVHYDLVSSKKPTLFNIDLLPDIANTIQDVLSPYCKPKITWLVSDDKQVLERFLDKKSTVSNKNDEIGMHCLISKSTRFEQAKEFEIEEYLQNSVDLFKSYKIKTQSIRVAGCASSNAFFSCLEKQGFRVDSSAVPGRKREIQVKFDWETTKEDPYFPSKSDYRITDKELSNCYNVLEIPLTTIYTQTTYDRLPLLRYLDLCFKPKTISAEMTRKIRENSLLVTIIHPMQLLQDKDKHELFANSLEDFKINLLKIVDACTNLGKNLNCLNLLDIVGLYKSTKI